MSRANTQREATIRRAKPADLPAVELLLTQNKLPLDGVREAFEHFLVAESADDIVGVAGLEPCDDDALLRSVAVAAEWRGQGLGRDLVARAIADAESREFNALYLLTTTAERYFPAFGFVAIERSTLPAAVRATREFTTACSETAIAMRRSVTG